MTVSLPIKEKRYEVTCLSSQANSGGVYPFPIDLQIPLLWGHCALSQGAGSLKTPGKASRELCKDSPKEHPQKTTNFSQWMLVASSSLSHSHSRSME